MIFRVLVSVATCRPINSKGDDWVGAIIDAPNRVQAELMAVDMAFICRPVIVMPVKIMSEQIDETSC